jgi:Xaa-Pro aminopeptidase
VTSSEKAPRSERAPDSKIRTGSHDLPVSPALDAFMGGQWALTAAATDPAAVHPTAVHPAAVHPTAVHPAAGHAARRRAALSALFPGERLVIPSGVLKSRSNDQDYRFRPHSAFVHLTAAQEPEWCLVLEPDRPAHLGHEATLYVRENAPRTGGAFYRDRRYGEFWVGPSPSAADTSASLALPCRGVDYLADDLAAVARDERSTPTRLLRGVDPTIDALLPDGGEADLQLETALSELRLVKDEWEIGEIARAVDATARGFEDVVRALPAAVSSPRGERWVEGVFQHRARVEGNGLGYETIAASGAHACVLHWTRNDGRLREDDLLLLDAGVEADSLHTADVTRTLPVSGRFSPAQRKVYDLVYLAQQAGIGAVRPGARFRDFHRAAMTVIAEGLEAWGILPVSAAEALRPDSGLYRRYTLCSSGHMLGLDVHDCARARAESYLDGVLEVGYVLTVEPGLYFQPDDLTVPEELRGIGVRIEDDVVVTPYGCLVLSSGLPRQADEIEAWMARLWADAAAGA